MLASRSPAALVAFTAVLWGAMWLPARWMDELAASGLWAWIAAFALPALLLAPWLVRRRRTLAAAGWLTWFGAALFALSFALYPEALVRGQVARVVLLFHASVVWSTLLGWWFLGEPIGPRRAIAVALGIAGLVALFGLDAGLPVPRSGADWMAFLCGVAWSGALVVMQRVQHVHEADKVLSTVLLLALAFAAISLAPGGRVLAMPVAGSLAPALAVALLLAVVWLLPLAWVTVHAAGRLQPGKLSVILMLEIVVGIASAWLLGGEVPGPRELTGLVFIVAAILAETVPVGRRSGR